MASKPSLPRVAALTFEITSGVSEIQLLPAGEFSTVDGRPQNEGINSWFIDAAIAQSLIQQVAALSKPRVIDYEHQTLLTAKNGQPAPASGWFKELEWREGDGLYAIDVDWTANASTMIASREYRYISPVFTYDKQGNVTSILHAALTNNPALDSMSEVMLAAASRLASLPTLPTTQEESSMDELLERLRWLLNLPLSATAADVIAELDKLKSQLSGDDTAAAAFDLLKFLSDNNSRIAALTANAGKPDPAKFVPVDVMQSMQSEIAALTAQVSGREIDELVTVALSDGRLLPTQEAWARGLGKDNLAGLKGFLATAPKIAALTGTQTGGIAPTQAANVTLTDELTAVCAMFGTDPTVIKKAMEG